MDEECRRVVAEMKAERLASTKPCGCWGEFFCVTCGTPKDLASVDRADLVSIFNDRKRLVAERRLLLRLLRRHDPEIVLRIQKLFSTWNFGP